MVNKIEKHINTEPKKLIMNRQGITDLSYPIGYKIRQMRGLLVQLQADYAELNRLWKRGPKGLSCQSERDEITKYLSWTNMELKALRKMRCTGIEGISWGNMDQIYTDVKEIEIEINGHLLLYAED